MPKKEGGKKARGMNGPGKRRIWAGRQRSLADLAKSLMVFWVFGGRQRQTFGEKHFPLGKKLQGNLLKFHNTFVTAGFA